MKFDDVFTRKRDAIRTSPRAANSSNWEAEARGLRDETKKILEQAGASPKSKDSDYVFITFVLNHLPHGLSVYSWP